MDDLTGITNACYKLNSLQLRAMLERYQPAPDEPARIPPQLIDNIVRVSCARATGRGGGVGEGTGEWSWAREGRLWTVGSVRWDRGGVKGKRGGDLVWDPMGSEAEIVWHCSLRNFRGTIIRVVTKQVIHRLFNPERYDEWRGKRNASENYLSYAPIGKFGFQLQRAVLSAS